MKLWKLAVLGLCWVPVVAAAGDAPSQGEPQRGGRGQRPPERRWRPPIDEAEWEKTRSFFEANSPNRWAAFSALEPLQQERLRGVMIARYRMVQWLERDGHKALMEIKQKQIQIEDRIFKIRQELLAASPGPEADKLRQTLRDSVRELVRSRNEERGERLKGLEAYLAKEKAELQKALATEDQSVEAAYQAELSGGPPEIVPEPGRRRPQEGAREPRPEKAEK